MKKLQTVLDALEGMAQEPVAYVVALKGRPISMTVPVNRIDELAAMHNAPLYAAPVAVQAVPAWLPIESAPKDGTEFLGLRGNKIANAYKVQHDDCEMWCFGGSSGDVEIAPYTKPTHWMPLPAAPKGAV
jgi:Protein of unknown function (DUF551)